MVIDQNNYIECFLLYADNELTAEERRTVESYVESNPRLKPEFDEIKATIFPTTEKSFSFKSSLIRLTSGISAEEAMLLHLDGELSGEDFSELQTMLESDEDLKQEYAVLQNTRLNPVAVECPFTETLYRKPVRRIPVYLWASGIAAMLTGVFIFFGINNTDPSGNQEVTPVEIVQQNTPPANFEPTITGENQTVVAETNDAEQTKLVQENKKEIFTENNLATTKEKSLPKTIFQENLAVTNTIDESVSTDLENINMVRRNISPLTPVPTLASAQQPELAEKNRTEIMPIEIQDLSEQETAMESIGHVFVVNEEKVARTGIGGWMKKVKKSIEQKTVIKLPEVSVAGWEIAIR